MTTRPRSRQTKSSENVAKTATLQDVAAMAGVTSMTVSRVIKGRDGVGAKTRERVLRIAEELSYTPNLAARALATGKTGVIAVLSGALNQPYYANIAHVLETQITDSGYQMRLLHTHNDLHHLVSSTNAAAVDGVIIAGRYHLVKEFRALAPQTFRSCVFIDTSKHSDTDTIYNHLATAVEEALELMLKAGRTRLAYIDHFDHSVRAVPAAKQTLSVPTGTRGEERRRTYTDVMERAGLGVELIGRNPQFTITPDSVREYLQEYGCPQGLLCVNDETAMYAYRAIRDAGYRVPDDVMMVGCDGLPFMECFEPPLSTIALPIAEICDLAWKFLQARIANPDLPPQQVTFDAKLIVRRSLQP